MGPILDPNGPADRPRPRPTSPARSAEIRVLNRRSEYLERHPEYFESLEHEFAGRLNLPKSLSFGSPTSQPPDVFADPLLYDTLVRRFQSATEREAEGRAKGYGRILEGSLARAERRHWGASASRPRLPDMSSESASTAPRFAVESELAPPSQNREEGLERWRGFLRERFVRGCDTEFDYTTVDDDDDYDTLERKDSEDAWFSNEEPGWASDISDEPGKAGRRVKVDRILEGETGVQDY